VRAVLFFSPTCGHCHDVITGTLPPLFLEHGGEPAITVDAEVPPDEVAYYLMSNGRLELLLVDVSLPDGQAMFQADTTRLDLDGMGVPRLDVADTHMVGAADIPAVFPGIVEDGLAGDGIDWPAVPGLDHALAPFVDEGLVSDAEAEASAAPSPEISGAAEADGAAAIPVGVDDDAGPLERVGRDPLGNGIAVAVLVLLTLSAAGAPLLAARGSLPTFRGWLAPVLATVGVGVAAYLAFVETGGVEAVCGPVGDCNAVQQSDLARFFGIPVGILGIIGYVAIVALWIDARVARGGLAEWGLVLVGVCAMGGTLFSLYLTFLEPFVIGASCLWCISSALVMAALLWVSAGPAVGAWRRLRGSPIGARTGTGRPA
jgi:uncharacterized membrane protein